MQPDVSRCARRCARGRGAPDAARAGPRRRAGRVPPVVRPRHRRDARGPRAGRLAVVAPDAGRLGLQPPRPDRPRQRRDVADGVVARPDRGQPGGDAARLRRRPLHAEPRRRHPGHRRGHRRPRLGAPPRVSRRHRGVRRRPHDQPQHRHLRPAHHRHQRRQPRIRPRRGNRPPRVGDRDPRLPDEPRPALLRPHHRRRQGRLGAELHAAGRPRRVRHHRPRRRDGAPRCGGGAPSPPPASPATRRGAASPSRSASMSARGWPRATTPP